MWKGSGRVFIFYLLSSCLSPYETKVFSFWIQKFSCIKHSLKISLELEMFTSLPMIINLAWFLNLWPCCWKCLEANIAFAPLVSFRWLSNQSLPFLHIFYYIACIPSNNNVLNFTVNFMIDFKFSFGLLADKCCCWC